MSTIYLTVSKRAIEEMKRRAREAADRGPVPQSHIDLS